MKVIEVTVTEDGDVSIETKGYAGSACKNATKFLEEELGVVKASRATSEMYAKPKLTLKAGAK